MKVAFVAAAGGGTQQIRIVSAGGKSLNTGKCRNYYLKGLSYENDLDFDDSSLGINRGLFVL